MSWKKSTNLIGSSLNRHGLGKAIEAGMVCQHAESLYPKMFRATSLVNGVLRVTVPLRNQAEFRLIEGKLLQQLRAFTTEKNLPIPSSTRLTIVRSLDTL
jgi:hypothetical protein